MLCLGLKDIENRSSHIPEEYLNKTVYIQVSTGKGKQDDLKEIYADLKKNGYLSSLPVIDGFPIITNESSFKSICKYFHNDDMAGKIIGSVHFSDSSDELQWSWWYCWPTSVIEHYKKDIIAWIVNTQTAVFWREKKSWIKSRGHQCGLIMSVNQANKRGNPCASRQISILEYVCYVCVCLCVVGLHVY